MNLGTIVPSALLFLLQHSSANIFEGGVDSPTKENPHLLRISLTNSDG
jgi:hypothetical protein